MSDNVTIHKIYCPLTGNHLAYPEGTIFRIATRRSNCPKKTIYLGKSATKAMETFSTFKIFDGDFKYFEISKQNKGEKNTQLVRIKGEGNRPNMKPIANSKRYRTKDIYKTTGVPETLYAKVQTRIKAYRKDTSLKLSVNSLIPILFNYFLTLEGIELEEFIFKSRRDILTHMYESGLNNSDELLEIFKPEDVPELPIKEEELL